MKHLQDKLNAIEIKSQMTVEEKELARKEMLDIVRELMDTFSKKVDKEADKQNKED